MNQTEIINIFTKKTLGLTFVLSAAALAFAQEKVSISGTIVNKNNQPVPYASVTFSNKSSKLLSDAALTDERGQYKLNLAPGNYDITVEAIDYKRSIVNKQIAAAGNIGALSIEPEASATNIKTQDIQGVVITAASTKPYKVELDKKTYDPSQDIVSKGGNLQDVLANVPSVSVDTDGTVSMRGSTNVKFLINGKPSALLGIDDGANALQSIPADQIERIEVITNPSSKFEASGTSGILNIILKKNKKVGFNGNVTGTLGYFPRTALNANLSWRKNNWTWFLNGGGGYSESQNKNNTETTYHNIVLPTVDPNANPFIQPRDIPSHQLQNSTNKTYNNNYNVSAGFVYDISEKTSLNLSGVVRTFEGNNNEILDTYNTFYRYDQNLNRWNQMGSFVQRDSDGESNNLAFQGDIGLDHKFDDKGQNLAISLSVQRSKNNNGSDILETENMIPVLQDITQRESVNKTLIGKADYELPIGEKSKIEAGYRLDINNNQYDNFVDSTSDNPFLPNYNNTTDYREMFNAFYLQFRSKIGSFGYQLGVRDELSNVKINYDNLAPDFAPINKTKNYNNLFPSIFLSYDVSKDNQILVNYSRRIDRPRSFFMVPFPSYSNSQNIFEGNIDLNPSYVDSYEVGYNISRKKFTINPTLYYRHATDDTKMLVYRPDESENVFYTRPINLGSDDRYGLDLNFTYDPLSWLKIMGSLDLFGYKTSGIAYYTTRDAETRELKTESMDFTGDGFSSRVRLNTTFKIDKTFSVQLQGFYRGGQKTANQNTEDMYALNFGASKTIWKGDGTISFNIQDIFNTRSREILTFSSDYTRRNYMQWQPRQFSISLTYRFKQGEKVEQPKKKKDINANDTNGDDQQGPM
ncbi:outer membrane receptor protein involved in Fe transport [Chryseobacterium defluvii]|uniref:Outer membrane receptor protein involved in Fe transport n=1 Tax=Chryseobacterium defluvii TaxID=160396 RepID=A0A840KE09_9FLAO|nr:TonB-dependent receptor [Chryseobacterium defluvii]MBB4805192.1 outer membrane receptor protein involved in Fe transport [Chryseobacterium defluvii]